MEAEFEQQVFEAINKAGRILIACPRSASGDSLGSSLALYGFLKKLDKDAEIVCSSENFQDFGFLPDIEIIKNQIQVAQSFVISLKTQSAELDELSYEVKDGRVDIFLKPKKGKFNSDQVTFRNARFPYDLIFTVDTPSLEHLGEVYEKNTDLFFETPIVNIDHHPNNEHYGQINLVDLTATSTAEILASLIEGFESNLIDEHIATNLLTGIIVETNSFQHVKTTPRAFLKASSLISLGARQQDIVRGLYKTKNISLLKLWGRALARIREVPELNLSYSLLSSADLQKAGAEQEEIFRVMKEMVASLSNRRIVMLMVEVGPGQILGYLHFHPAIKSQVVISALSAQMQNGSLAVFRIFNQPLLEATNGVIGKLLEIKEQISS